MILGRTPQGLIKIKTDGGLRAVNCACCNPCQPLGCNYTKVTNTGLINLLNSATSGSLDYSQGTDSLPSWTSVSPDSFQASWSCCNSPIGCENCEMNWDYIWSMNWFGSQRNDCFKNVLYIYAFDLPWGYSLIPEIGYDNCPGFDCDPLVYSSISINGYQLPVTMSFGCGDPPWPIYPMSITLT